MSSLLRRLRATLVTAALWGGVWAGLAALLGLAMWIFVKPVRPTLGLAEFFLTGSLLWGVWGALNGTAFAVLLSLAERRRTVDTLPSARVAAWGALGGALFPLSTYTLWRIWPQLTLAGVSVHFGGVSDAVFAVLLSSAVGAGVAAAHLRLARRLPANVSQRQLPRAPAT